ncbi:MAG: histidine kinase [Lachnospiraceae bacterium]|nr:histidine kinase [Lachnospiraceae bacterium]
MFSRHSIRFQLAFYLILAMLACIFVTLFSNRQVSYLLSESDSLFGCNQNLTDFYSAVEKMDKVAREYIYSKNEDDFKEYQRLEEEARKCLEDCKIVVDSDTSQKITRLSYMLDYYYEPLESFRTEYAPPYETYRLLLYRNQLIRATTTRYYSILADYMSRQTQEMQGIWIQRRNILLTGSLGIAFLGLLFGITYIISIDRPVRTIVENIHKMKHENYEFAPKVSGAVELVLLDDAFHDMASRVQKNMETLRENARLEQELLQKENENLVMTNLVTEADLRNLQSQINPHFLFNTMNMISKSAYINGDEQTCLLMEKLSAFLRYALDKAEKTSSLFEEFESIKNYLFIQKKRFGDRAKFIVEIQDNIPNISMPAIILQPLVENAIIHGIGSMTDQASVMIGASYEENCVKLHIEDNGAGMNSEQLEELQIYLHQIRKGLASYEGRKSIGIGNVCRRLYAFYGEKLEFMVESEEDCGTILTIAIPAKEEL